VPLLRADALEWTWFVNSFSKGHMYEFMYGDKDTYGLGFALAGKAHMYTHVNMPPGAWVRALVLRLEALVCMRGQQQCRNSVRAALLAPSHARAHTLHAPSCPAMRHMCVCVCRAQLASSHTSTRLAGSLARRR
jgi:hypothetical protein